jgi:chromosome segregation ATPase
MLRCAKPTLSSLHRVAEAGGWRPRLERLEREVERLRLAAAAEPAAATREAADATEGFEWLAAQLATLRKALGALTETLASELAELWAAVRHAREDEDALVAQMREWRAREAALSQRMAAAQGEAAAAQSQLKAAIGALREELRSSSAAAAASIASTSASTAQDVGALRADVMRLRAESEAAAAARAATMAPHDALSGGERRVCELEERLASARRDTAELRCEFEAHALRCLEAVRGLQHVARRQEAESCVELKRLASAIATLSSRLGVASPLDDR